MDWLHTAAGFGVGLLVGFTGVGGGALMTPILIFLFGTAPHTAIGTDLLFAALTKSVGVGVHGSRGTIDWQVLRRLSLGSLPAATATTWILSVSGGRGAADRGLMATLGIMLVVTAFGMFFKENLHAWGRSLRVGHQDGFKRWQAPLTVLAGAFLGVMVTLTSVGAGALGAVFMLYLYPLRLTPARLVGTDLAHAIPLALVAGAGHFLIGSVDFTLLGWLLAGSIPGVILGAMGSVNSSELLLRRMIAIVLLMVGIKIVW